MAGLQYRLMVGSTRLHLTVAEMLRSETRAGMHYVIRSSLMP